MTIGSSTACPEPAQATESPRRPSPRTGLPVWASALALALAGAGAIVVSLAFAGDRWVQRVGPNVAVNAGADDPLDISAHNSPTLVRNPTETTNVVIANRIDTPRYSCALHVSTDAGATFGQTPLPIPRGEEPKCYAPDVAFGPDGTLYVVYVTLKGRGNVPSAAWIATSGDGGRTLSEPRRGLDELSFQVRIVADPRVRDRVYLMWLQAEAVGLYSLIEPGNPIVAARSDDGGETWGDPVRVSDARRGRALALTPQIARDGTLYVAFLDLGGDRLDYEGGHRGRGGPPYDGTWAIVLARSTDGARTWRETVVAPEVTPTERFISFTAPAPALAVAPGGANLYVAFQDGTLGDPDVIVWRSSDGGATWSQTRVNDTQRSEGRAQYRPQIAVAPDGRVDVIYYDRRADPRNARNEVSLQSSFDGGENFQPRVALSDTSFDSGIGPGSERNLPDLGNRLALLSTNDRALAVWADTRAGTRESGKQDLARAVVAFAEPARLPAAAVIALRVAGAAALLAAFVLAVPAARRRATLLWRSRRS